MYHIAPNVTPDEIVMGEAVINAAGAAGVAHFCYHSVLHPQTEDMPHHWNKLRVEEHLVRSGLPFTILQPTAYMQNILSQWKPIVEEGTYQIPYAAETRLSLVDLEDVVEAAATILTEPGHIGATYELVGTKALSQTEVAAVLSQELGRPVHTEVVSRETWKRQASAAGLGRYQTETLIKMFQYYEKYGFEGNPGVLTWLLKRRPTALGVFVARSNDC